MIRHKGIQIRRKGSKLSLFADDIMQYIEKLLKSPLETIGTSKMNLGILQDIRLIYRNVLLISTLIIIRKIKKKTILF